MFIIYYVYKSLNCSVNELYAVLIFGVFNYGRKYQNILS